MYSHSGGLYLVALLCFLYDYEHVPVDTAVIKEREREREREREILFVI
jgi:hypothetical protein